MQITDELHITKEEMQQPLEWTFRFDMLEEKRKIIDDEKHKITIKYVMNTLWNNPNWIPMKYEDFVYDEHIYRSIICLVFYAGDLDTDIEITRDGMESSSHETLRRALYAIVEGIDIMDNKRPIDEVELQTQIRYIQETFPNKFSFLFLKKSSDAYTPVYINRSGNWYRFDTFPLHPEPIVEKPAIFKCNSLSYKRDWYDHELETEYWLLGRDPRTKKTQGVSIKLKIKKDRAEITIMIQYHAQYEIMNEILNSKLIAIHLQMNTRDLWNDPITSQQIVMEEK